MPFSSRLKEAYPAWRRLILPDGVLVPFYADIWHGTLPACRRALMSIPRARLRLPPTTTTMPHVLCRFYRSGPNGTLNRICVNRVVIAVMDERD